MMLSQHVADTDSMCTVNQYVQRHV